MENTVANLLAEVKKQGRVHLTEVESKEVLKAYGIKVNAGYVATDPDTAATVAGWLGYPVVMKILSPDISHKSDVGGVRVNLDNPEAVRTAFSEIMENAKIHKPDAYIQGIMVDQMVPEGVELVIGATFSRQFGHAVMFGLGVFLSKSRAMWHSD